ncbi:MAG: trimethylamine corrinoid protein 2, partial [Spirochaetales bacterium]|nr:trimethylamine corrinoid protein 2 [Spirochaetales bacterium]
YHLDGPGALRHLDALLDIKELDAVQWVPGAGNEGFSRWIDVYKKIQAAGKSMQITSLQISEIALMFENLRPEGVYISGISGVTDDESADALIRRIAAWN